MTNLIGICVGRLQVVSQAETKQQSRRWNCVCVCGGTKTLSTARLTGNRPTQSCGCLQKEATSEARRSHGEGDHKHGTETKEYRAWCGIKRRCFNKNVKHYPYYGGAGITMADGWKNSYETFLKDVGRAPSAEHSIDRIDPFGNYEPGNIRWTTNTEQARNTQGAWRMENGESVISYCERKGIKFSRASWAHYMGKLSTNEALAYAEFAHRKETFKKFLKRWKI